jgi:hypothetical protein
VVSTASSSGLRSEGRPCFKAFWETRCLPSVVRGAGGFGRIGAVGGQAGGG